MTDKNEGWTWCCHHDRELEYCYNFRGRVSFIRTHKPKEEHAIRLREFRFVKHPERLPAELTTVEQNVRKALMPLAATDSPEIMWRHLQRAYAAYAEIESKHTALINALHLEEFPETSWNGVSISLKDTP